MRLWLTRLEDRDCPAADAGGGDVFLAPGVVRHCFEDAWAGPLNVYDPGGDRIYVGAGSGGGPRVQVYNRHGDLLLDFFAGDPASRAGIYFVPTDPPPAEQLVIPRREAGPADGWTVFVDFERPVSLGWAEATFDALAALLTPAGLRLTTERPDAWPGQYGTLIYGAPLGHAGPDVLGLAGEWVGVWLPPENPFVKQAVFARALADPRGAAVVGAHEVGHALGLDHRPGNTIMSSTFPGPDAVFDQADLTTLAANAANATRSVRSAA